MLYIVRSQVIDDHEKDCTDSFPARLGAEAAAAETAALAALKPFGPAHIGAVAGPKAEALEPVALRLAKPCLHHSWSRPYNKKKKKKIVRYELVSSRNTVD